MRRTDLVKRLAALGYAPIGQDNGRHEMFYGPRGAIPVQLGDIVRDDQAAAILRRAAGL